MRHPLLPTSRWGRRSAAVLLTCACLTACSKPVPSNTIIVVDGRSTVAASAPVKAPLPAPTPTAALSPTAAPPLQRFTSPPLPPELADDGALKPLPARPPAEAFGQGEQH